MGESSSAPPNFLLILYHPFLLYKTLGIVIPLTGEKIREGLARIAAQAP